MQNSTFIVICYNLKQQRNAIHTTLIQHYIFVLEFETNIRRKNSIPKTGKGCDDREQTWIWYNTQCQNMLQVKQSAENKPGWRIMNPNKLVWNVLADYFYYDPEFCANSKICSVVSVSFLQSPSSNKRGEEISANSKNLQCFLCLFIRITNVQHNAYTEHAEHLLGQYFFKISMFLHKQTHQSFFIMVIILTLICLKQQKMQGYQYVPLLRLFIKITSVHKNA